MLIKCPRCEFQFESEADASDHLNCPQCGARLRLKQPASPAPAEAAPAIGEVNGASPLALSRAKPSLAATGSATISTYVEPTLEPGTRLGGFEVRKVLGRGGMAIVYRGVQLSLNRPVAIKVLLPRFASNAGFIERFDLEAGALANLNHPNIVNIIDKGAVDDNYYFVMELVEGITLDQLLHTVELNERQYTHIISEISKALSYVHSKGIVHRDIKPSNVLVNKHGLVKVSDFGIAHITRGDLAPERFGKNATVGTANYMAPEQAENPGGVDKRADIYALAITFYKMFTKQLPTGDYKSVSLLNPKLPRAVDAVLTKAMKRNPDERFPTVQEFCDALIQAFTPAQKSATGSEVTDANPFLFNPALLTIAKNQAAQASPGTDASDASSGSFRALFVPGSDSDFGKPPTGADEAEPEPAATKAAKPKPEPAVEEAPPQTLVGLGIALVIFVITAICVGIVVGYLWINGYWS